MGHPLIINVARIPESGLKFKEEEPGEILELGEGAEFLAAGPVSCDLYAQVVDETLILRGTVSAPLEARCARCTQIFSTTVADSGFLRDFPGIQGTEEVDVTGEIREAVLLSLPHFPLCDENCKGLCAQCGKNLNSGPCGCRNTETGGSWGALNNLKL
ncbi:MAG: DUF177 domain-containing protein [Verrucomicrobia bacterium]|nr:DUF177 domain-containing protein [Verrucomicrobiota bacterium]